MMKENLKKILIEVPTIVVGVLIALAVNEWSVERERDGLKEKVNSAIREELEYNRNAVQKAYDYHVPLFDDLLKGRHKIFSVPMKKLGITAMTEEKVRKFLVQLTAEYGKALDPAMTIKKNSDSSFSATIKEDILKVTVENDTVRLYGEGNIILRPAFIRNNAWKIAQAAQIAPYLDFKVIAIISELDRMHSAYNGTLEAATKILYEGNGHIVPPLQDVAYFEKELLEKYDKLDLQLKEQ